MCAVCFCSIALLLLLSIYSRSYRTFVFFFFCCCYSSLASLSTFVCFRLQRMNCCCCYRRSGGLLYRCFFCIGVFFVSVFVRVVLCLAQVRSIVVVTANISTYLHRDWFTTIFYFVPSFIDCIGEFVLNLKVIYWVYVYKKRVVAFILLESKNWKILCFIRRASGRATENKNSSSISFKDNRNPRKKWVCLYAFKCVY